MIGIGGVILRDSRIPAIALARHRLRRADPKRPSWCQIYFIFFALPLAGSGSTQPTAIIALGVNGGAYAIEIIRGGWNRSARDRSRRARARPAADAGIPADRAEAGAADHLSGAGRPVHPADADDEHRVVDIGLRTDLGRPADQINTFRSFEVYARHPALPRYSSIIMQIRAIIGPLLQLSGEVRARHEPATELLSSSAASNGRCASAIGFHRRRDRRPGGRTRRARPGHRPLGASPPATSPSSRARHC